MGFVHLSSQQLLRQVLSSLSAANPSDPPTRDSSSEFTASRTHWGRHCLHKPSTAPGRRWQG